MQLLPGGDLNLQKLKEWVKLERFIHLFLDLSMMICVAKNSLGMMNSFHGHDGVLG
jgi:hypothetical protein